MTRRRTAWALALLASGCVSRSRAEPAEGPGSWRFTIMHPMGEEFISVRSRIPPDPSQGGKRP